MNKQEAAEFLEVSVRALERYVQQGRISVKYEKGKTRSTANFNQQELEALKTELNQPVYKPSKTSEQPESDKDLLLVHKPAFDEMNELSVIDRLAAIIEGLLGRNQNQSVVPIVDKLLLTLSEVQALTGLSKGILRSAINSGTLKAKVIGKSWRIKRSDLDEYVNNLF